MAENVTLAAEHYGVRPEGVRIKNEYMDIIAPTGQTVMLKTAIYRSEYPETQVDFQGRSTKIPKKPGDAVWMSGFATFGEETAIAFESLGRYYSTVFAPDHPDAPTTTVTPHNEPLNKETFSNSGFVVLRAIEKKILDGTLEGPITAIGMSTGCPELIEAVALDILEAEEGKHKRYINSLILLAPAGMMEKNSFGDMAKGLGKDTAEYFFKEYLGDLIYRIKHPLQDNPRTINKENLLSREKIEKELKEARDNPEWEKIFQGHKWFKILHFAAEQLNLHDFLAFFHRTYAYHEPHILPRTQSVIKNEELIAKNVTEEARKIIKDTDIRIELYEGDSAVPPEGFLKDIDKKEVENAYFEHEDFVKIREFNENRGKRKPMSFKWLLENKKQEMKIERIMKRVKELFPNNANTQVAISFGANHITPKTNLDLVMDSISARE